MASLPLIPAPTLSRIPTSASFLAQTPTSKRALKTHFTSDSINPSSSTSTSTSTGDIDGGMSGGAIAGLVVGILFVLICSVVGGFLLLKKRRKRMMSAGRGGQSGGGYVAYQEASTREQKHGGHYRNNSLDYHEDDHTGDGEKGGVSQLLSGWVSKARRTVTGNATAPATEATPPVAAVGADVAMQTQGQQQSLHRQHLHLQQHQSWSDAYSPMPGIVPPFGVAPSFPHLNGSPSLAGQVPSTAQFQAIPQNPYPQHQYQQHQQQVTPTQSITAPASQPYYYQPGTGLVSVPLSIPPMLQQEYYPQQQQYPAQYAPRPHQYTPVDAADLRPAPSVPVNAALPQTHHQPLQQVLASSQAPASVSASIPNVPKTGPATPDPTALFLPGDASRPLLGQGLFKIVPDIEDDEEAKYASFARGVTGQPNVSSAANGVLPVALSLDEDLVSSVITYENQDQRFQALEEANRSASPFQSWSNQSASGVGAQTTPGVLVNKEQRLNEKHELDEEESDLELYQGEAATSPVVLVGSDVVLEPLPSAKAAAKAAANETTSGERPTSSATAAFNQGANQSQRYGAAEGISPRLNRMATLGAPLPTMGTEEYLERTDDKEEYNFGQHGDRSLILRTSEATAVVHPPTRISFTEGAEGDFVDATEPFTTPSVAIISAGPPPLARSTKPNLVHKK